MRCWETAGLRYHFSLQLLGLRLVFFCVVYKAQTFLEGHDHMFLAAALFRLTFRIRLTIVTWIGPPAPQKRPEPVPVFVFILFSCIQWYHIPHKHHTEWTPILLLFCSVWELSPPYVFLSLPHFVDSWADCQRRFHLLPHILLPAADVLWGLIRRWESDAVPPLLSVCSVNKVLFELAPSMSLIRTSRPFILVNVGKKNTAKTLHLRFRIMQKSFLQYYVSPACRRTPEKWVKSILDFFCLLHFQNDVC